jgi:Protein of unknown function (DUF3775)
MPYFRHPGLNIFIKQIRHIIRLARCANAADAARKQMPLTEETLDPTPEQTAVIHAVEEPSPRQQIELHALMSLGRGDFDDFSEALDHSAQNPEHISTCITTNSPLAEYLSYGLKRLLKRA